MRGLARALVPTLLAVVVGGLVAVSAAQAQYFRRPVSHLDPRVVQIDEQAHLGAKISPETQLVDHTGRTFAWKDMLGKPTILVLAYYTCDGACSLINQTLADLLARVSRVKAGQDFRIVTLSFDRHDTLATTDAFRRHVELAGPLAEHWTFATFKSERELAAETERIGFKFFWSPEDRLFLHPGAFLFFSPDGRLIRVLYQQEVDAGDVEFAVLDAKQGNFRPREIVNLALSVCYSYDYRDGKYRLSIPLIVGAGALASGLLMLFGSIIFFKVTRSRSLEKENGNAQQA